MATAIDPSPRATSVNDKILFWASFLTLIAAGIGFSVRSVVLVDWGQQYGFTQAELGSITGGGLAGFGLAIIFFSFFADLFGYGKLMLVAFLFHAASAVVVLATGVVYAKFGKEYAFYCLTAGSYLFALGNGTCEAVINPLTATLFPNNKTHYLNMLHAGWPLGLILGVLISLGFRESGADVTWQLKYAIFLVPVLIYGFMMFNRVFPRSEASASGVTVKESMGVIGGLGFAVAAALIGVVATSIVPDLLLSAGIHAPWAGWAIAIAIWVTYFFASGFALGSALIAFLYVLHALVGYVELGTDSWINNIGSKILKSQTNSEIAFIWTNALMFTLRFFAGPIVHRINPIGLLIVSAICGTIGLALMGYSEVVTIGPWLAAVTIYGIGKTFYWPTLLGVISERFPRGGALALGLSGGIGMMAAGAIGGPGIGYKQDYFASESAREGSVETYERYRALNAEGQPELNGYPIISSLAPQTTPRIAGLDNAKLKISDDYAVVLDKQKANNPDPGQIGVKDEIAVLDKEIAAGRPVEPSLDATLRARLKWWQTEGLPNYATDRPVIERAVAVGSKQALLYTALVPAVLVVGFVLLYIYFAMRGGYKQVYIGRHEDAYTTTGVPRGSQLP